LNSVAGYHAAIRVNAERFGVSAAIHPDDHIFNFVLNKSGFTREAAIEDYFSDGARSAKQFLSLVSQHLKPSTRVPTVLEFASGYGMVTRHLALDRSIELIVAISIQELSSSSSVKSGYVRSNLHRAPKCSGFLCNLTSSLLFHSSPTCRSQLGRGSWSDSPKRRGLAESLPS
jgi:hypothetical protein